MVDVDKWLGEASAASLTPLSASLERRIELQIAAEPSPEFLVGRRNGRTAMFSGAAAALIAFTACISVTNRALARSDPTWVASPPAASPYSLLIGR